MKITVRLRHSKKSKTKYISTSVFFFDHSASTGPVIKRGDQHEMLIDVKPGDVVEFSTTKFNEEYDLKQIRKGGVVNSPDGKLKE